MERPCSPQARTEGVKDLAGQPFVPDKIPRGAQTYRIQSKDSREGVPQISVTKKMLRPTGTHMYYLRRCCNLPSRHEAKDTETASDPGGFTILAASPQKPMSKQLRSKLFPLQCWCVVFQSASCGKSHPNMLRRGRAFMSISLSTQEFAGRGCFIAQPSNGSFTTCIMQRLPLAATSDRPLTRTSSTDPSFVVSWRFQICWYSAFFL